MGIQNSKFKIQNSKLTGLTQNPRNSVRDRLRSMSVRTFRLRRNRRNLEIAILRQPFQGTLHYVRVAMTNLRYVSPN
ncbi:MAG: hypothetical protein AAF208_03280 [Cyanobacteria bacterium P01_A01_bin.45]